MTDDILKHTYKNFCEELDIEYKSKESVEDLEQKLINRATQLKKKEFYSLSKELQDFYKALGLFEQPIEKIEPPVRDYDRTNEYGIQRGTKRDAVCKVLTEAWYTRAEIIEEVKKTFGSCSINTLDFVETYLRKNKYPLKLRIIDDVVYLKLEKVK